MRDLLGFGNSSNSFGPLGGIAKLLQLFSMFSKNPITSLLGMNINIPENVRGNPEATVNYLRNSGQMTEDQFNQYSQLANMFQSFLPKKF